jgi:2-desacetyl-2-hydroxyethyl bacteriochlorophyllide A dehydrogenase
MATHAVFMTGVRQVEVRPVELGSVGPQQVRTGTLYSGISHGTEMAFYRGTAPHFAGAWDAERRLFVPGEEPSFAYPSQYGYLNVGEVVEVGSEVGTLKPGDVVFGTYPHQAELVADSTRLIKLPSGLDPKLGVFLLNTRTTYNGVLDAGIRLGETVVIFGQGALGQLSAQMARLSGAGQVVVVDPIRRRREMALQLGADLALDPGDGDVALAVRDLTGGRGADVVIEISGAYPALQEAVRTVTPHGTVVAMGFYQGAGALSLGAEFHHNWVDIRCSQAGSVNPALSHRWSPRRLSEAAAELLLELKLAPLVTHTYKLDEAAKAYALIDEHPEDVIQVVLEYD